MSDPKEPADTTVEDTVAEPINDDVGETPELLEEEPEN